MNIAIIVAAGSGTRMNSDENKAFLPVFEKPMVSYTLKKFENCGEIDQIAIVTRKEDIKKMSQIKEKYKISKVSLIVEGGKERQDSVYNGVISINASQNDIIVIHNASNPLVSESEIMNCIKEAKEHGAAVVGFPLKDTIKKARNGFVEETIDRDSVYQMQTPQAIKYGILLEAFRNAKNKDLKVTDDASLVEAIGQKVKVVPCSYENFKITTQDDLKIADSLLAKENSNFKVGFGQDSHKFSNDKSRKLVLGGFIFEDEIGLEANSDGDVILHALFNAISSAIGEKSLGAYSDSMCIKEGITNSKEYLRIILEKMKEKNLEINNVSVGLEAGKPKLEKHLDKVKDSLSNILDLGKEKIGITVTSGEGLTEFGKGHGIQCFVYLGLK